MAKRVKRKSLRLPPGKSVTKVAVSFKEFELENGLKVILRKDSGIPLVAVNVAYHVGSKNEVVGKTGFAHLFEHLMFEGSENVKKGDFDRYISLAGGYNNAYTTEDVTNYYEVLPSNQLSLALWLESDRMFKFSVTDEALSTQREVVKEEKRYRVDNRPYGDATEKLQRMLFPVGQYNWPVIGSMEDLDAARMTDVKDFFERFYTPGNAVLSVSGDIDPKKSEQLIRKYFEAIPAGASRILTVDFQDERLKEENIVSVHSDVPAPAVFVGYKAPPEGSPEYYALSQITKILSDGNSSRLYKRLVYDSQAVSDFDASVEGMEKASVFVFSAFLTPGHSVEEVLNIFDQEMLALHDVTVDEYEFAKARNSTISGYVGRLSTNNGVADALAHYRIFFDDTKMINTELDRELAVTRESIKEVSRNILTRNERAILFYHPDN